MSLIRDRTLAKIRARYGDPVELASDLLMKVIQGEETVDIYRPTAGEMVLVERRVRQTQQAMANGAAILERLMQDPAERELDALLPDKLRLTDSNPYAEHLRRLDRSIVAREDNVQYVGNRAERRPTVIDVESSEPEAGDSQDPFK